MAISNQNSCQQADSAPFSSSYIGRFAPSPTGALHFGSLLAALASFLDARANQGQWLVRMEDLDPPREAKGAADDILKTLEQFGLEWDGTVMYQSRRQVAYQSIIDQLLSHNLAYRCDCSRQQIHQRNLEHNYQSNSHHSSKHNNNRSARLPIYDGYCRTHPPAKDSAAAIRIKTNAEILKFEDQIQGHQQEQLNTDSGDFVIHRKDNLFAYQLAVVCDDAHQGITHIVRGCDLLDSTPRQLYLQRLLHHPQPCYAHIPIMVNKQGQKLSKQTYASAIDSQHPVKALFKALQILGQQPESQLSSASLTELLASAIANWSLSAIPRTYSITDTGI